MSDLFDLEVPLEWFDEAWGLVVACDRIAIQICTKRVSAVEKRLAQVSYRGWPQHAGLLITVVDQKEVDRDVPRLLALKEKLGIPWVGLSIEPMLGPIRIGEYMPYPMWNDIPSLKQPELDWVIVGGESGAGARAMDLDWARSLRDQCAVAGVAFFMKQVAASRPTDAMIPADLMIRQFPAALP